MKKSIFQMKSMLICLINQKSADDDPAKGCVRIARSRHHLRHATSLLFQILRCIFNALSSLMIGFPHCS